LGPFDQEKRRSGDVLLYGALTDSEPGGYFSILETLEPMQQEYLARPGRQLGEPLVHSNQTLACGHNLVLERRFVTALGTLPVSTQVPELFVTVHVDSDVDCCSHQESARIFDNMIVSVILEPDIGRVQQVLSVPMAAGVARHELQKAGPIRPLNRHPCHRTL
jgi:hypothetical protein